MGDKTKIVMPSIQTVGKAWTNAVAKQAVLLMLFPLATFAATVALIEYVVRVDSPSNPPSPLMLVVSFLVIMLGASTAISVDIFKDGPDVEKFYINLFVKHSRLVNPDGSLSPTVAEMWKVAPWNSPHHLMGWKYERIRYAGNDILFIENITL